MLSSSTLQLAAEALRAIAHDLDRAAATSAADDTQAASHTSSNGAAKALSADELVALREQILAIIRHHVADNAGPAAKTVTQILASFGASNVRDLTPDNVASALAALRAAFPPQ